MEQLAGSSPAVAAAAPSAVAEAQRMGDDSKEDDVLARIIAELQAMDKLTLGEVACGKVDHVAKKMKAMPGEKLEAIKGELRAILAEGLGGGYRHVNDLLYLQKLVQGRADLTPDALSMAHHEQLLLLVTMKTGTHAFMHRSLSMPRSYLVEVLLDRRCQNIACRSALPFRDCECSICSRRNGFCGKCMCMICRKFDLEADTCRWIRCDACAHWAHTDCALSHGHKMRAEQTMSRNAMGHAEMIFRCQACQHTSELMVWVRDVFQHSAAGWDRDALLRELGYVCKIFCLSEGAKGRKLFRRCVELIESLRSDSADESMCRRMLRQALQEMDDHENEHEALEQILIDANAEPIELSYAFLENITNEFSQVIGSGGFGVVYMGVLRNKKVAVKKLFQTVDFSDKQFEDELTCLRRVKHKNIVRFLGHCSDTQQKLVQYNGQFVLAEERHRFLCFEYVPNKSLHDYLKGESYEHEWDTRYRLIRGICEGLLYLHNEERINHLDLKPENILLDAEMVPKITDFGLSRRFSGEQSRIFTENIRGSRGYIAPEYWGKGEISFKSDIFSLGIIIKKLLWGSDDLSDIENWHQSLDIHNPLVERCIEIVQRCVDDDQHKRPTIDWIIDKLREQETMCIIDMLKKQETMTQLAPPVFGHSYKLLSSGEQVSSQPVQMLGFMELISVKFRGYSASERKWAPIRKRTKKSTGRGVYGAYQWYM